MIQKFLLFLCFAASFLLCSCGEQASQASASIKPATATQQKAKPVQSVKSLQTDIQVNISSIDAKKGEEVCVSFTVADFDNILAYQHSIKFNPIQLVFKRTKNYGLPHLSDSNFGATKAKEGSLNFLWFDMNVKGESLDDKAKVFDLCFEVKAKKGTACDISIADKPIKMEVVGPQKQKLKLNTTSGAINVR